MSDGPDWLDRLARRAAPAPPVARVDGGLSRAAAIRLVVAGAATAWLGLHGVKPAHAATLGDCLGGCAKGYDACWNAGNDACAQEARRYYERAACPNSELRAGRCLSEEAESYRRLLYEDVRRRCRFDAINDCAFQNRDCQGDCRQKCRGRGSCKPDKPRKPKAPPLPPDNPPPAYDPCGPCMEVRGMCCGPVVKNAPCACATPGVPCSRYGCG